MRPMERKRDSAYGLCSQEHRGAQEVAATGKAEIVVDWGRQTVLRPHGKAELQKVVLVL